MIDKVEFSVEDNKYVITQPTQQQIADADLIYKSKYSEAVRVGALTHAEAMRFINDRKIWTDDDTRKASSLLMEIAKLGAKLEKMTNVPDGLELVSRIEAKRVELLNLNGRKNAVLDQTAESYADEKRLNFYVAECTYDSELKRMFKDTSDLINQGNTEVATEATRYTIQLLANEGEDFRTGWPDYQWRIKNGLLDDELNPIEGALDKVVQEVIEDNKPAPKKKAKKKTRKKTAKK